MPKKVAHKSIRKPLIIIGVILVAILAVVYINRGKIVEEMAKDIIKEETEPLEQEISRLEQELASMDKIKPPMSSAPSHLPDASQLLPEKVISPGKNDSCEALATEINDYFAYLDQQDYIVDRQLPDSSKEHIGRMVKKLLANPPIVVRETDSLFTILTNTAHFFRVLGPENVGFAKDLISHEGQTLEPTLAMFYKWSAMDPQCQENKDIIHLPLQGMYEYAGFFLNTLGGQAYLFRRNSKSRLLLKYYCILILDRANAKIVNRHGIDIRLPIKSMLEEIESSETLIYKDQYLQKLLTLQEKYQVQYDPPTQDATTAPSSALKK